MAFRRRDDVLHGGTRRLRCIKAAVGQSEPFGLRAGELAEARHLDVRVPWIVPADGGGLGGLRGLGQPAAREKVVRGRSAVLVAISSLSQSSSPVGRLARLGWTRIGSPGIFGVPTRETMC